MQYTHIKLGSLGGRDTARLCVQYARTRSGDTQNAMLLGALLLLRTDHDICVYFRYILYDVIIYHHHHHHHYYTSVSTTTHLNEHI